MKALNLEPDSPWKQRFRAPSVPGFQLANQNPDRGIALTDRTGVFQLYAWDVPTGALRQVTHEPTGLRSGFISSDGKYIYYLKDDHGNEIGHFVRVPFEGGEPEDISPDLPPYSSWSIAESQDGSVMAFAAFGAQGVDVYVKTDGKPVHFLNTKAALRGLSLSADGKYIVTATNERTGRNEFSLTAYNVKTGGQLREVFDNDASVEPGSFSPLKGDSRITATTDVSGANCPFIWNVETGERADLDLSGVDGDVSVWDWSPDAKQLLLCQIFQAKYQLYAYELATRRLTKLDHPSGSIGGGNFTQNGEIFITHTSTRQPASILALDSQTGKQKRVVLSAGTVPEGTDWRSVTFPSLDNTPIQAWLAVPAGTGPFPTIIDIHGGPTAVLTEGFHAMGQSWVDHGFAWLSVNYRGSTTFGKAFERAIWGRLGQVEVEDLVGARNWLVENQIADPAAILLTGWSYGGYLTLLTLGRYPDLWAGGMAGIAIADWTVMYEDEADTLRSYQRSLFGGTPQETPEAHAAASPITYAAQVKAPIVIIQGSNDTRCPARQMRGYEEKMKSLGKSVELHWFEAGHGSLAMDTKIEHQEIFMRFAYRVLG